MSLMRRIKPPAGLIKKIYVKMYLRLIFLRVTQLCNINNV